MLRRSVLLLFLTAIPLAGCSTYLAPVISVGGASLAEVADEALSVDVAIDLENPNAEPLELRSITYTVSIDGRPIYAGKRAAEATLAAAAVKTITLPAVVRYDRVDWDGATLPAEIAWSLNGKVLYVRPGEFGEILLDAQLVKPMAAFGGGGTVGLAVGVRFVIGFAQMEHPAQSSCAVKSAIVATLVSDRGYPILRP